MKNDYADWYEVSNKSIELSMLDWADSYEVDQAMIGIDKQTGNFFYMTASGCSCWGGEAEIDYYGSLEELEKDVMENENKRESYISIGGDKKLIQDAKDKFNEICLKAFKD